MTSPLLAEARLKLNRGKEHLDSLYLDFRKFWDLRPYAIVHQYDSEKAQNSLRFVMLQRIPQYRWGLILGDAIHNVRSALDYIVWRLAGSDFNDRASLFPIYKASNDFNSVRWKFESVHPDALKYIESIQPYTRPDPKRSILWVLQELDARDKHKLINMTETASVGASFRDKSSLPVTIPYAAVERPIKHNTILAEYPGPPQPQVDMEFDFSFAIFFEQGVISEDFGDEIGSCMDKIFDAVNVIIDNFESRPDWFPS